MAVKPLETWAAGKPLMLGAFAVEVALAAEECHGLLMELRRDCVIWRPYDRQGNREWIEYYAHTRKLLVDIGAALGWREQRTCLFLSVMKLLTWSSRADRPLVRAFYTKAVEANPERFWRNTLRCKALFERIAVQSVMSPESNGFLGKVDWSAFFQSSAAQFFFRVAVPCLLLFGRWPSFVLRDATRRKGPDLTRLKSLISLDKRVVAHDQVQRLLLAGTKSVQRGRQQHISKALQSEPPRLSRKQVKNRLGRLIIDVFERFGHRLTTTDVSELFHAVAASKGSMYGDGDLAFSPEALSKGMQREKDLWDIPYLRT